MADSLGDDSSAECGNRALPGPEGAANCILLAKTGIMERESCALGLLPFLVRTESNIHLIEIYRNIVT